MTTPERILDPAGAGFDWNEPKALLKALLRVPWPERFLELRLLKDGTGKPAQPRAFWLTPGRTIDWRLIERLNRAGWGVFFGPGLRRVQRGTRKDVARVEALWVDVDVQTPAHPKAVYRTTRQAFLAFAERLPAHLFPSVIVHTGNGLQAYWLLRAPILVANGTIARVETLLRRLATILDGDPMADVCRILRLPGSWNMKDPARPKRVRFIHLAAEHRFTLNEFDGLLQEQRAVPRRPMETETPRDGSRSGPAAG